MRAGSVEESQSRSLSQSEGKSVVDSKRTSESCYFEFGLLASCWRSGPGPTDPADRAIEWSVDLCSTPDECGRYSRQKSRARKMVALSH